jgi:maltose alpha-D-glucosyltransferase/alpha-amylase
MKEMIESSSDGWTYILDRLDELNEKILASPDALKLVEGLSPQHEYEDGIHPDLRDLFSGAVIEQIRLLGFRTAELHKALAIRKDIPAFAPEKYSLHYQRSLFAGFQSLIRETFHGQRENVKRLDPDVRHEFELLKSNQQELQNLLKEIYQHKINVVKIRIHGDYHLGQLLFTGKDFVITNFEGEPTRSYSERRLKRSPLRDVAAMIRSLHYAAYANLINEEHFPSEDFNKLMPVMEAWHRYVSRTFLNAYIEEAVGTAFVPETQNELDILMTTFQLEKALNELKHELAYRPDWVIIPINGIKSIMENFKA